MPIDFRLIEGLDNRRVVAAAAVQTLQLNRVVCVGGRRPYYPYRIVAEAAGHRTRTRTKNGATRRHSGAAARTGGLDYEIIVAEAVNRVDVGIIGRSAAGYRLVAIRDDFQQPSRPDDGTVRQLDNVCEV